MNDIKIIFDCDRYVVCRKPKGITSEDGKVPGVPSALSSNGVKPLVVHRLDREVDGVMVLAKTSKTAAVLSKQITEREFQKEYLAVVSGDVGDGGTLEDLLFYDRSKNKTFTVKRERAGVKKASLEFDRLETVEFENVQLSLVKIRLHTGRTHQIRVQFASRKHPVLGDGRYGSDVKCPVALFSHKISFCDSGQTVDFKALPDSCFPWNLFEGLKIL